MAKHFFSQEELNLIAVHACFENDLDLLRFSLTDPDLDFFADVTIKDNEGLEMACGRGYLDIVKYLLTSPNVKPIINIQENRYCFRNAWWNNQIDVVDYLLCSDELKNKFDLYSDDCAEIIEIFENEKTHEFIINYLIIDLNLEMNDFLLHWLSQNKHSYAWNLYQKRELNNQLLVDLKINKESELIKI